MKPLAATFCLLVTISLSGCSGSDEDTRKTIYYVTASEIYESFSVKVKLDFCSSESWFTEAMRLEVAIKSDSKTDSSPEMGKALKLLYEEKCR
jgi:hypothetical protein